AARRARAGHVVVRRAAAECEQGVGCLGARGCDRSLEPLIGEEAAAEQSARDLARHLRDPEPELAVVLLALELEVATREVVLRAELLRLHLLLIAEAAIGELLLQCLIL